MTDEGDPTGSGKDERLHLSVHPSVVFKLGEDLITDDVQALLELVKNAYDADSPSARIVIESEVWTHPSTGAEMGPPRPDLGLESDTGKVEHPDGGAAEGEESPTLPVQGRLTIVDRGVGMSAEDIRGGWVTVSASPKRAMKAAGLVTSKKKRTPLGDKGLGRLGAQRLGDILEIDTVPEDGDSSYSLRIPWRAYEGAESLQEVDLPLSIEPRGERRSGTTITVRGLRDPDRWRGDGLTDVERQLSLMVSPYGTHGFDVRLTADGEPIDLRKRPRAVRDKATVRYTLAYANGVLHVHGLISTAFFRPQSEKEQPEYRILVEDDNGAAFRGWLLNRAPNLAAGIGLIPGDDAYFIEVSTQVGLSDLEGVRLVADRIADPGPFSGEIDGVGIRRNPTEVFNSDAEYKAYVREINGVRVYRDGFGIRLGQDWLGLGEQWTSGKSYYNLRPENVIGYVDLSAQHNGALVETTNREGFQDTPHHRNFMLVMEAWRRFTENAQSLVRRQYVAYRKEQGLAATGTESFITPGTVTERARSQLATLDKQAAHSNSVRTSLAKTVETITTATADTTLFGAAPAMSKALEQARESLSLADQLGAEIDELRERYHKHIAELEVLGLQVETVQQQLSDAWEAVSLGITAEALSHEVHQIADRLRGRSQTVARHLAKQRSTDTVVGTYVEHVRASAAALNRQLSHLNPSLRYLRERRTDIKLSTAVAETADYFTQRWSDVPLTISHEVVRDFTVVMNAGKLSQVLDNIVLNSEFWLKEQQRRGEATSGSVEIRVESPHLTVTDSGPGVEPSVEELLFEPFITMKGRGRGRGLGLFVVRQLLDSESAEIELEPTRDSDGRRRTFRITFPLAADDGKR